MLTRDPNKVGYSGLECPDVEAPEKKSGWVEVSTYVEAVYPINFPEGKTQDDVVYVYESYDSGNGQLIVEFNDNTTVAIDTPTLYTDMESQDELRFRVCDEEWAEEPGYDSWG